MLIHAASRLRPVGHGHDLADALRQANMVRADISQATGPSARLGREELLEMFGARCLELLEQHKDWGPETVQLMADWAYAYELAEDNDEGLFRRKGTAS